MNTLRQLSDHCKPPILEITRLSPVFRDTTAPQYHSPPWPGKAKSKTVRVENRTHVKHKASTWWSMAEPKAILKILPPHYIMNTDSYREVLEKSH